VRLYYSPRHNLEELSSISDIDLKAIVTMTMPMRSPTIQHDQIMQFLRHLAPEYPQDGAGSQTSEI
jgi:hypothetical protein